MNTNNHILKYFMSLNTEGKMNYLAIRTTFEWTTEEYWVI